MLVTGRAPASRPRAFPQRRDAGLYHLLFGLACSCWWLGTELPGDCGTAAVTAVLAVVAGRPSARGAVSAPRRDQPPGKKDSGQWQKEQQ